MKKNPNGPDRQEGRPPSPAKVKIRQLQTGVRGLDEILGGGLPEFSFNIIAGTPGCGKTTLAHQFVFANATRKRPALYFTVLGEPAIKMLRYQQQYSFFDDAKLPVVVDSFRTVLRKQPGGGADEMELQSFIERLAMLLTSYEATTFLIGEYTESEMRDNPVFTVADGIVWL